MQQTQKRSFRKMVYEYTMVTLAALIAAISTHTFVLPYRFVPGGASGLATILQFLGWMPFWLGLIVLNAPLIILGLLKLNRDYAVKSTIAILLTSAFKALLDLVGFFQFKSNILLSAIIAGVMNGTSIGMLYANNGSSGGSEIVARLILLKKPDKNVSSLLLAVNCCTMACAVIAYRDIFALVYSLILSYTTSSAMNTYLTGFDKAVNINVITEHPQELFEQITERFRRGCTAIPAKGYSRLREGAKDKTMLRFVIQYRQLNYFRQVLYRVDPDAFTYAVQTQDVEREHFNDRYR